MRGVDQLDGREEGVLVEDLLDGEVQLYEGIRLSPIMLEGKLSAIRFSHDIHMPWDGWEPSGVCNKILNLQRRKGWTLGRIDLPYLTLWPSVHCPQHGIHGVVRKGGWIPVRTLYHRGLSPEDMTELLLRAEDEALEYGGGYEGALRALASRYYKRPKSRVTRHRAKKGDKC